MSSEDDAIAEIILSKNSGDDLFRTVVQVKVKRASSAKMCRVTLHPRKCDKKYHMYPKTTADLSVYILRNFSFTYLQQFMTKLHLNITMQNNHTA
jgi:hypothetical protein